MQLLMFVGFVATVAGAATIENLTSSETTNQTGRIVGGTLATLGQFPYYAHIRYQGASFCGSAIINSNTILTAAHCVYGRHPNDFTIQVGIINTETPSPAYRVASITIHAWYDNDKLINDIAIIKLSSNLSFNNNVRAIALQTSATTIANSWVYASGFGLTSYPGGMSTRLLYVALRVLPLNQCQRLMPTITLNAGNLCTTTPHGEGTCHGDSGGPLIDSSGQLIGIVSKGQPCAIGYPDVFVFVPAYYDWILNNV